MTAKIIIRGGKKLSGTVAIRGAKNSVLELIPATLLTDEKVVLHNVPNLNDMETICKLMECFGTEISWDKENHTMTLQTKILKSHIAPYEIVKTMRASIYVLGALLGRAGQAQVSFPGGCVLGPRPIDVHINAMGALGASIKIIHGNIIADAPKIDNTQRLIGGNMKLLNPQGKTSHGGTANAILAAVLARGKTTIEYASPEPEIDDLIAMLNLMGGKIARQKNTDAIETIIIEGVDKLHGCEFSVMPDRIEAVSYAVAGAVNGGVVKITNTDTTKYELVLQKLSDAGVIFEVADGGQTLIVDGEKTKLCGTDIETLVYPGFPTDDLPQFMTLLALADGKSCVQENITGDRFQCVPELRRMGAIAKVDEKNQNVMHFMGVKEFSSTSVMAADLRSGFALVIAGLTANHGGTTEVLRAYHIFRGYESFIENFRALGADIEKGYEE
ncbi:MAG: UDP-N-acetylglucosamine 1-carboxyvinyltransferase [Rickettsiales bacterium]|jgi:UDP-N-acetylglucosamine 1-carboxyvinyltransferase|nr:UDP-N-acetylglucosamine 1-carboxyvinyltransferase [Rickettsiales bacterium]